MIQQRLLICLLVLAKHWVSLNRQLAKERKGVEGLDEMTSKLCCYPRARLFVCYSVWKSGRGRVELVYDATKITWPRLTACIVEC